jgi:ABC-type uncharacterized transport system substrate-binding protein
MERQLPGYKQMCLRPRPIERVSRFELVINLKTAKTLGIDVPTTLLARADEILISV